LARKRNNRGAAVPVSPEALARLLKSRRGRRVVFTNGCFDILHVGHLRVLETAARLGDVLVVALNSDRSVRNIKGPRRPLVPLRDRARLMAALRPVDFVTYFHEDTPERLIRRLKPDVLVKGGDWAAGRIVGSEVVKKVVRVPLARGRSTTGIVEKILKVYGRRGKT
jgi:rfaE bifunctional protein nucleotidyltransferase chain/domain